MIVESPIRILCRFVIFTRLRYRVLLASSLEVCLPSFASVTLCLILNLLLVRLPIDPPADDDNIASTLKNDLLGSPVLLSHLVSLDIQSNSRREDHKVLILGRASRVFLVDTLHGNETEDETVVTVSSSHLHSLSSVLPCSKVALARHFSEEEKSSVQRLADRGKTGNDAVTRNRMSVGNVRPVCDLVYSGRVL